MSEDDVLFGYLLQLFDYAARTSGQRDLPHLRRPPLDVLPLETPRRSARLEVSRPRKRRRPRTPNQLSAMVEERIVAFAIAHPVGAAADASELRRRKWGGIVVSANGIWRCLRRHGLNTRSKRLARVAGYRAPYQPPREPGPEPHIEVDHPGELVGFDCFFVGRLRGTKGAVWQLTAIDCYSSFAWARARRLLRGQPDREAKLVARAADRAGAGGGGLAARARPLRQRQRFKRPLFHTTIERLGARVTHIHAGRPQTNGHVEALHKTILGECWRPVFARYLYPRLRGLRRELDRYLAF